MKRILSILLLALLGQHQQALAAMAIVESTYNITGGDFDNTGTVSYTLPFEVASGNAALWYCWKATAGAMTDVTMRDAQGNAYTRSIPAAADADNGAWFYKAGFSANQTTSTFEWTPGSEIFSCHGYEISYGSAPTLIGSYSATGSGTSASATVSTTENNLGLFGRGRNNMSYSLTPGGTASGVAVTNPATGTEIHPLYTLDAGTTDNPTIGGTYSGSVAWGVNGVMLQEGGGGGASPVPKIMQQAANDPDYSQRIFAQLTR